MHFEKHVKREVRELLREQLKEYELHTKMTQKERQELHAWVARGRSPYDNGDYLCDSCGYPLDFISALRSNAELQEWFDSLTAEEKEAEINGERYCFDTQSEDVYLNLAPPFIPESEVEELPFQ